jgi:hypothetical protein
VPAELAFDAFLQRAYDTVLRQNQPMILGARDHAVVLTAIDYATTARGAAAVGGGVFDPCPGAARELFPTSCRRGRRAAASASSRCRKFPERRRSRRRAAVDSVPLLRDPQ